MPAEIAVFCPVAMSAGTMRNRSRPTARRNALIGSSSDPDAAQRRQSQLHGFRRRQIGVGCQTGCATHSSCAARALCEVISGLRPARYHTLARFPSPALRRGCWQGIVGFPAEAIFASAELRRELYSPAPCRAPVARRVAQPPILILSAMAAIPSPRTSRSLPATEVEPPRMSWRTSMTSSASRPLSDLHR